jgi:hypothetical protein
MSKKFNKILFPPHKKTEQERFYAKKNDHVTGGIKDMLNNTASRISLIFNVL